MNVLYRNNLSKQKHKNTKNTLKFAAFYQSFPTMKILKYLLYTALGLAVLIALLGFFAKKTEWLIAVGLVAVCLAIYAQTFGFEFINIDDRAYIFENPAVLSGLLVAEVRPWLIGMSA